MYKKLPISYKIPNELEDIINQYVIFLNTGKGLTDADDYYTTEIQLILNWCFREQLLSEEQIKELRNYYQRGGIKKGENNGQNL